MSQPTIKISTVLNSKLNSNGGTMTGALTYNTTTGNNPILISSSLTTANNAIQFINNDNKTAYIGLGATSMSGGGYYCSNLYFESTAAYGGMIFNTGGNVGTNVPRMIILANGKVGLGTTNPISSFHIYEATGTDNTATYGTITLQHGNSGGVSSILFTSTVNYNSDFGYIKFIDNVGSTSSYTGYNYFGATNTEVAALIIGCENDNTTVSGPDSVIINPAGNIVLAPKNNVTYITGNVGIGTTNPGNSIDVRGGNINTSGSFINNYSTTSNIHISYFNPAPYNNGSTSANQTTSYIQLCTSTTAGFAVTAPYLTVKCSDIANAYGTIVTLSSQGVYWSGYNLGTNIVLDSSFATNGSGNNGGTITFQVGTYVSTLNRNGFYVNGTFISSSDKRLKTNIETLKEPLNTIKKLRGVSFNWIEKNNKSMGLIAQEVEEVLPFLILNNIDGFKGISYNSLIGLLIEGIKEQQEQINKLIIEVENLKNK